MDDGDEDDTDDEEFPWLKRLHAVAQDPHGQQVGRCQGMLISRDKIRGNFLAEMDEVSQSASDLSSALFDRWGCLQSHFYEHPIKKGTGAWGRELDEGPFLLIEILSINKEYRRQGYGKRLFADFWGQALEAAPDCGFAVVWPTHLNDDTFESENLTAEQADNVYSELSRASEDFWRSVGFRRIGTSVWFGLATDPNHNARGLSAVEDYRRPYNLRRHPFQAGQTWPCDQAIFEADDDSTLSLLKARQESTPATDPLWLSVDGHGNTILHIVSITRRALTLTWLLQQPFANTLLTIRNLEGSTALEHLQSSLENYRRAKEMFTDDFDGFTPNEVKCLTLLSGIAKPSSDQFLRLKYGCTCGACLAGFISPRLSHALETQAYLARDMMKDHLIDTSGSEWVSCWSDNLMHIAPEVRRRLRTNKAFRRSFMTIVGYVAELLQSKIIPTQSQLQDLAKSEKLSHLENFLNRGGNVSSAVLACFDRVLDEDVYIGNGEHQEAFEEDLKALPACRNDREFVFACRRYCLLEGLPTNAAKHVAARIKMGSFD
ncbi:hypothetical protein G7Y79_00042g078870 [Physcia stellaris]|nr:hypothetical protein G7Y79_00042g078870 [Physcia stellaris]